MIVLDRIRLIDPPAKISSVSAEIPSGKVRASTRCSLVALGAGKQKRLAAKVIDVQGNQASAVLPLAGNSEQA
jgi:hypothetical protein